MESGTEKTTPLMQQYFDIKTKYQDTLLLFQVGDFYELFFDDAKKASSFLAIALTKRGKNKGEDIPLCGIPVHAVNHYLTKLIKGGFRVALCEQLTKPQPGTVVERGVTRVFTPATLTDASMLDEKSASYLLSLFPGNERWSLIFGELLTAQLFATHIPAHASRMIETELTRFFPDEIIVPKTADASTISASLKKLGYYTTFIDMASLTNDSGGEPDLAREWISHQFCSRSQQYLEQDISVQNNMSMLYAYLQRHQTSSLSQFKTINFYDPEDYVILDPATQKNLEIVQNSQDGSTKNTLFAVLDHAKTAMGSRTIRKWLHRPLIQTTAIAQRLEAVALFSTNVTMLQELGSLLSKLSDVERIIGRIALKRAQIFDYRALKDSLSVIPLIKAMICKETSARLLHILHERIADFSALYQLLMCSINDDSSSSHIIKPGYDMHLDRLRNLLKNSQHEILSLEQAEIERTGIPSLKIAYNNISGYYIEVTNTHNSKVPDDYQHQQTLANRKRFMTTALKSLERDIFRAQHELDAIEASVFERVKKEIESYITPLRHMAQSLAYIDALFGFATAAYEYRYCMPTFNEHHNIIITQGRHPVIEQALRSQFTPNDTHLTDTSSTILITGPNMGGKSTYLRQNALMCIMAQCGSFVPATTADLPILDRIFTRIGSGDNLAEGKSTFLVEMEETATICTQATKNSLVILDEVGRGTSTYDGMALAQSIIEHIHQNIKARCLFATHYHELTHLEQTLPHIINLHTACKRVQDRIIFLHKIIPGVAEGSFGLDVARLAGLPEPILHRAAAILRTITQDATHIATPPSQPSECNHHNTVQENIIQLLQQLDCSSITPKQALETLWDLSTKANKL